MNNDEFVKRFVGPMAEPRVVGRILIVASVLTFAVSSLDWHTRTGHVTTAFTSSPRLAQVQPASEPVKENQPQVVVKQPGLKPSGNLIALALGSSQK
jgi:hypothetical protein